MRSPRRVPQRILLGPIRIAVGVAADALGRLDGALARVGSQPPPATAAGEPEDADEKIIAVRKARDAAIARRDTELAGRLAAVEQHLVQQQQGARADTLLPLRSDRPTSVARLEDIRQQLLANTPRPDETERDEG